ncbi:MAG: endonuclease [Dokdonella sp.]
MAASVREVNFTVGSGETSGYYAQVNTSSAEQLRCTLHLTIRGHTASSVQRLGNTNTWTILEAAQANPDNPNQVLDVYRNRLYTAVADRAGTGSGLTYSREHTWLNSLGFRARPATSACQTRRIPTPTCATSVGYAMERRRSNSPYGNCPVAASCGERTTEANGGFGGGSGIYPGNSNWVNNNTFETWNHHKGDVARAVMYMAIRYEGSTELTSGQTSRTSN